MIPILYEKNETEFVSNGLCRLRDATSVLVTEERNSIYECDFDYPVDGANFEQIRLGRIIAVEHDDTNDIQPFDIVSYTKPINGVVSFHAVHISYRQSKIVASGQNVTSLEAAFQMLKNGTPSNPFTYWTDKSSTTVFPLADNVPRSVRECLGGTEGSVLDTYGGEFEWDKFTVKLWSSRGSDVDFVIRYGVNMTEYNDETDSSESYSAIIPYWVGQNGDTQTVVKGAMQTNGTTVSGRVDAVAMDFSQEFESGVQPTAAQLEALAQTTLASKQPNLAAQTIKVGFIRLQDSDEYGQLANLLKCKLCDTVRVEFPRYNMSGRFKIVKTVYDVLLDRFTSMELGTLQTTLSEALGISSGSSSYSTTGGASVLDFYPIGAYYETSDSAFDPNASWGGTWVREPIGMSDIADSGWQTLYSSGSQLIIYRKIGKTVFVNGYALQVTHNVIKATLPAGYRPDQRTTVAAAFPINKQTYGNITTDGNINPIINGGGSESNWYFQAVFSTSDSVTDDVYRWHRTA